MDVSTQLEGLARTTTVWFIIIPALVVGLIVFVSLKVARSNGFAANQVLTALYCAFSGSFVGLGLATGVEAYRAHSTIEDISTHYDVEVLNADGSSIGTDELMRALTGTPEEYLPIRILDGEEAIDNGRLVGDEGFARIEIPVGSESTEWVEYGSGSAE